MRASSKWPISSDGRTLGYYNLQNGDGSRWGDYRFCDEKGHTPEEDEGYVMYGEAYFNIGGWDNPADVLKRIKQELMENPDMDIKAVLDILDREIKKCEE